MMHMIDIDRLEELETVELGIELIRAAYYGDTQLINTLLEIYNVDVNFIDSYGQNAIHDAVLENRVEAISLLLARGARVDIQNRASGWTPVHIATQEGNLTIMQLLLARNNLVIDIQDVIGRTALHIAVEYHHIEAVALLLQYGINIYLTDNDGFRAIDYAMMDSSNTIILEFLANYPGAFTDNLDDAHSIMSTISSISQETSDEDDQSNDSADISTPNAILEYMSQNDAIEEIAPVSSNQNILPLSENTIDALGNVIFPHFWS